MYRTSWIQVLMIGIHLVSASTLYPSSWNCSTEPQVPCIAYDIIDDSHLPESDYFCLDNFPQKYNQVRSENGTLASWTFRFNDTTIDGFCIENSKLWRVLLLQDLEHSSFPFALNLSTWIADSVMEEDEVYIHPLITEPRNWNHVTKDTDFVVVQISPRVLKIIFSSDKSGPDDYVVECLVDSCDNQEPAIATVHIQSNDVTFYNLTAGNYCFMFTPQDPYPLDTTRCLCYYGNTYLRQCYGQCGTNRITYSMKDLEEDVTVDVLHSETVSVLSETVSAHSETVSEHPEMVSARSVLGQTNTDSNDFPLATLLGALSGCIVVIVLFIIVIVRQQQIRKFLLKSKLSRRKVLILAVYDSSIHRHSVECLSHCLETYCRCSVDSISIDVLGKESKSFRNVEKIMATFDVVIVILSQRLLSLFEEIESSHKVGRTLMTPKTDLTNALLELLQPSSQTLCKIVTLHFSGSSKKHSIINLLSAFDYHLFDEFERFLLKVHYEDNATSEVSKQCLEMMEQLHNTDKFRELKDLVRIVEQTEVTIGGGPISKPRLQSLNVDSGKGSSLSRISIDVNNQMYENIYTFGEKNDSDELSTCSVWSDSGRRHHGRASLTIHNECLRGVLAKCECDMCSLSTIGEFSV